MTKLKWERTANGDKKKTKSKIANIYRLRCGGFVRFFRLLKFTTVCVFWPLIVAAVRAALAAILQYLELIKSLKEPLNDIMFFGVLINKISLFSIQCLCRDFIRLLFDLKEKETQRQTRTQQSGRHIRTEKSTHAGVYNLRDPLVDANTSAPSPRPPAVHFACVSYPLH